MSLRSSTYDFSPVAYYKRFKRNIELHNSTQDKSHLFYAALELRYTIESILFYYLQLTNGADLSVAQRKLWRGHDLGKEIEKVDPHFAHRLEFISMLAYMDSQFAEIVKPDFKILSKTWSRLGDYLHAQKHSNLPEEFWLAFSRILREPCDNIALVLSHPFVNLEFTSEGNEIIKRYAAGEFTLQQVAEKFEARWGVIFKAATLVIHEY